MMSRGYFDYIQWRFGNDFVEPFVEQLKKFEEYRNLPSEQIDDSVWEQCFANEISEETMEAFRKAARIMKQACVYAQRIDWFLSGDDGEKNFHERLEDDLEIASIIEHNVTDQYVFQECEGKSINAYETESDFCKCVYFVCTNNAGYDEWKLIYHIETNPQHFREHHADRMIEYLKKDFNGVLYYQIYNTKEIQSLAQKHDLRIINKQKMGLDLSWNIGEIK